MRSLKFELPVLLWVSFVLAAFAGFWAVVSWRQTFPGYWSDQMLGVSAYAVGPIWIVLALVILHRHGKRGLWVLLGLPFALSGTGIVALLIWACATGRGCV